MVHRPYGAEICLITRIIQQKVKISVNKHGLQQYSMFKTFLQQKLDWKGFFFIMAAFWYNTLDLTWFMLPWIFYHLPVYLLLLCHWTPTWRYILLHTGANRRFKVDEDLSGQFITLSLITLSRGFPVWDAEDETNPPRQASKHKWPCESAAESFLFLSVDHSIDFVAMDVAVNAAAGALKAFFADLPDPLIPYTLHPELVEAASKNIKLYICEIEISPVAFSLN